MTMKLSSRVKSAFAKQDTAAIQDGGLKKRVILKNISDKKEKILLVFLNLLRNSRYYSTQCVCGVLSGCSAWPS